MGQVDSWATAEKDETKAEAPQAAEASLRVGQRCYCVEARSFPLAIVRISSFDHGDNTAFVGFDVAHAHADTNELHIQARLPLSQLVALPAEVEEWMQEGAACRVRADSELPGATGRVKSVAMLPDEPITAIVVVALDNPRGTLTEYYALPTEIEQYVEQDDGPASPGVLVVGSKVRVAVYPYEGQTGTVVSSAEHERPRNMHPARTVVVEIDGDGPAWFTPEELTSLATEADVEIGNLVCVVGGEYKTYLAGRCCEVMRMRRNKGIHNHAYVQSPPPNRPGIEDAEIRAAWVNLEHLKPFQQVVPAGQATKYAELGEKVFQERQRIQREATAEKKSERQVEALSDAIAAFVQSPEGLSALEAKDCSTGTLCEVLGLSGTKADQARIAEVMRRLGFRRIKVSKEVEQQTAFAYTWERERDAEEQSVPTERMVDEWEPRIAEFLASWSGQQTVRLNMCTTGHICDTCWLGDGFADRMRVARIMRGLGYEQAKRDLGGVEMLVWKPKAAGDEAMAAVQPKEDKEERPVFGFLVAFQALLSLLLANDWKYIYQRALWDIDTYALKQLKGLAEQMDLVAFFAKLGHVKDIGSCVDKLLQCKLDAPEETFREWQDSIRWRLVMNEAHARKDAYGVVDKRYINGIAYVLSEAYSGLERRMPKGWEHAKALNSDVYEMYEVMLALKHVLLLMGASTTPSEVAVRPYVKLREWDVGVDNTAGV